MGVMLNEFAKQKGLDESLGRDETSCVRLFTNNVLSQATVNFIVNFHSWICAIGNPYAI